MEASVPVVIDRPKALPRARIVHMLIPTPMTAVSRGSPAAATEPKVISRTTAASPMPMASPAPPAAGWVASAVPPVSTVRPASRASSTAFSNACLSASVRSPAATL